MIEHRSVKAVRDFPIASLQLRPVRPWPEFRCAPLAVWRTDVDSERAVVSANPGSSDTGFLSEQSLWAI